MAIFSKQQSYEHRWTGGTLMFKNMYSMTFGYTELRKKAAAGTTTAVLAATNGSSSAQTITAGITQPDVPRVLSLTVGGSASGVQASSVQVNGYNFEGKPITETFNVPIGGTGTYNGTKAFRTVTSVVIPAQVGSSATFAVGTLNIFGLKHRLFRNNTTVKVYHFTGVGIGMYTGGVLQAQPTVTANEKDLELNTVQPATAPNGSRFFVIAYTYDNWALSPVNDQPEYSTTTSTSSTSSSTSTTTITTSTSSTSTSSTSTSISTSSTSSSTSSTSTSTTTTP